MRHPFQVVGHRRDTSPRATNMLYCSAIHEAHEFGRAREWTLTPIVSDFRPTSCRRDGWIGILWSPVESVIHRRGDDLVTMNLTSVRWFE